MLDTLLTVYELCSPRLDNWLLNTGNLLVEPRAKHFYWQSVYHYKDTYPVQKPEFFILMHFLCREFLGQSKLSQEVVFFRLLEVNLFKNRDVLESFIVQFEAQHVLTKQLHVLEIKIGFADVDVNHSNSSLQSLTAGTDFDPKERIFRNVLKLYTKESKVSLRYQLFPQRSRHQEGEKVEFR